MFPEAGGAAAFARYASNELVSFVTAWAACLALIVLTALCSLFAAHYLSVFWAPLATGPWDVAGAVAATALVAAIAIRGLDRSVSLGAFLGVVDVGTPAPAGRARRDASSSAPSASAERAPRHGAVGRRS